MPDCTAKPMMRRGELIHHHHHPVRLQNQRLTTKKIDAPETVLRMAEEGKPRRTVRAPSRSTVFGGHPPHHILVDLDTEYEGDLLAMRRQPKRGFRRFISIIAAISSGVGPFGPCFRRLGAKSNRYLRFTNAL